MHALYTWSIDRLDPPHLEPVRSLMMLMVLFALSWMCLMCVFQLSLWSKVSPRNLTDCLFCSVLFLMVSLGAVLCELVKRIDVVLGGEKVMPHLSPHAMMLSMCLCTLGCRSLILRLVAQIAMSSANRLAVSGRGTSLIMRRNKMGLMTLPCGSPFCSVRS